MDELALLLPCLEKHGDKIALSHPDGQICYAELARRVKGLAGYLLESGFGPDQALATALPNGVDQVVAHLAAFVAGVPIVRLNATFAPAQTAHCLKTFTPRGLVATPGQLATLASEITLDQVRPIVAGTSGGNLPLGCGAPQSVPCTPVHAAPGDIATITFTSGTTARPKGVIHSRKAVASAIRRAGELMRFGCGDVVVLRMALYGQLGMMVQCLPALLAGAQVELACGPPSDAYHQALTTGPDKTVVVDVPSVLAEVMRHPHLSSCRFGSLRRVVVGGDFVPPRLQVRAKQVRGDYISVAYGMTEVGLISILEPDHGEFPGGLVGFPLPDTEIRVVDDNGCDLPPGQMGDILVRTSSAFDGYWGQVELTRSVLLAGGWVATGDIGQLEPSGMLRLLGRRKEMLVHQGWKIAPVEVETVLQAHPGVHQAAIAGVGDCRESLRMEAFVVLRENFEPCPSREDLLELASARLAKYMVPDQIHFVRRLPAFPSGKLDRERLAMISLSGLWEEIN